MWLQDEKQVMNYTDLEWYYLSENKISPLMKERHKVWTMYNVQNKRFWKRLAKHIKINPTHNKQLYIINIQKTYNKNKNNKHKQNKQTKLKF